MIDLLKESIRLQRDIIDSLVVDLSVCKDMLTLVVMVQSQKPEAMSTVVRLIQSYLEGRDEL